MRQRPRCAGRVRDSNACRQTEILFEPRSKIGDQFVFAAKQMRRTFDVEEKTVGAIVLTPRRGGRGVAGRPQSQFLQSDVVGRGLGGAYLQKARLRAGIG